MQGYTVTDTVVLMTIRGQQYSVPRFSVNGAKVVQGIRDGLSDDELISLADPTTYINANGGGVVTVKSGVIKYNGENMPECIVRRLMDLMSHGLPVQYIVNFYERLTANPSRRAVQELFSFLENKNLPITPNGKILCYKAVNNNFTDKHSGRFSNRPGCVLEMHRNEVCDNADVPCSEGFHAGSLEYVKEFASGYGTEGGDRIVLVEVDPADVVSINWSLE